MTKTIELKVFGMTCDDCVRHVNSGLKDASGVQDVTVSLKDGMAIVRANDEINPEELPRLDVFKGNYSAQLRSVRDD